MQRTCCTGSAIRLEIDFSVGDADNSKAFSRQKLSHCGQGQRQHMLKAGHLTLACTSATECLLLLYCSGP